MIDVFNLLASLDGFVINEAFYKYVALIEANLETSPQQNATQVHHILPEAYFSQRDLPENNVKDRLVNLKFSDHVLAHYYLAKCTCGQLNKKMLAAFLMMTNFDAGITLEKLEDYQELYQKANKARRGVSPPNKGKSLSEAQKQKIRQSLLGHEVSAETRKRQSLAQKNMSPEKRANITAASKNRNFHFSEEQKKQRSVNAMGHPVSDETRAKISASRIQKHMTYKWINNGYENKQINPNDPIPDGWVFGRLMPKKIWITNGIFEKCILATEQIPDNWFPGRIKKRRSI